MNTPQADKRHALLRVGEAAIALFAENTPCTRARIIRLADRGFLACIRVGDRKDRLIPASELDRLLNLANQNLRTDTEP